MSFPNLFARKTFKWIIFFVLMFCYSSSFASTNNKSVSNEAKGLIENYSNSILQIRVIEKTTNKKSSIGSGFFVSPDGLIATNYHVISSVVQSPDSYRLEYLDYLGNDGILKIEAVDVIHDLAIVSTKEKQPHDKSLALAEKATKKGEKIYSLGNPHDLGLTIVEGINNGLLKKTRNEKIHFTGSLNPGMSGGPTIDSSGRVIGINVSTAGNQISFLVPVKYLTSLLLNSQAEETDITDSFKSRIEAQVFKEQTEFFSHILSNEWDNESVWKLTLPAEVSEHIRCWGNTDTKEDRLVNRSFTNCSSEDGIYISNEFETGKLHYSYVNISNRDLSTLHFYEIYQNAVRRSQNSSYTSKEYISKFNCHSNFIEIAQVSWRAHTCVRRYKKYPSLYDLEVNMTMIGQPSNGVIINLSVSGIGKEMSQKLLSRFFQEITWQP